MSEDLRTRARAAAEKRVIANGLGPHCTCGWVHPGYDGSQKHVQHVAEVTEQAVRANVAAEIRALPEASIPGYFATRPADYVTRDHAARIAEGKQP